MEYEKIIEASLFSRILSMNNKHFDFYQCNFKSNNNRKDGAGISKEGSGRVALYRASNIPLCFTLECNYYTGKHLNIIYPVKGEPIVRLNKK